MRSAKQEGEEEKPLFLRYPGVDFNAEDPDYWKHHFADDENAAQQEQRLLNEPSSTNNQLLQLPIEKLRLQLARLEADMKAELALIRSRYEGRMEGIKHAIEKKEAENSKKQPEPAPVMVGLSLRANRTDS